MQLRRIALVGIAVGALILVGIQLRGVLGVELSADSIRARVESLGWVAPLVYVCLLAFRQFLALPSSVILPAGGALFGVLGGTILGASGVLASGVLCFAIGRGLMGRSGLFEGQRLDGARAAGPIVLALVTAHPTGPMTALHSAAGAARMSWRAFLSSVGCGACVRAFVLSFFGATLLDVGSAQFWVATLIVVIAGLVPFAYAPLREWVFGRRHLRRASVVEGDPSD